MHMASILLPEKILKRICLSMCLLCMFAIFFYFGLLFYAHDFNPRFLKIDSCLDSGGAWDYGKNVCLGGDPGARNHDEDRFSFY
jgi:hypothetical protein